MKINVDVFYFVFLFLILYWSIVFILFVLVGVYNIVIFLFFCGFRILDGGVKENWEIIFLLCNCFWIKVKDKIKGFFGII